MISFVVRGWRKCCDAEIPEFEKVFIGEDPEVAFPKNEHEGITKWHVITDE